MKVVQLIGASGSGKTSCIFLLKRSLEAEATRWKVSFKFVYVNLKIHGESRVLLYRHMAETLAPELQSKGSSASELLSGLIKYLRTKKTFIVLAFDELDTWLESDKGDTSILYELTRLNEDTLGESPNVLGVLFAARSQSFLKKLDEAQSSTLGIRPILHKEKFSPCKTQTRRFLARKWRIVTSN